MPENISFEEKVFSKIVLFIIFMDLPPIFSSRKYDTYIPVLDNSFLIVFLICGS